MPPAPARPPIRGQRAVRPAMTRATGATLAAIGLLLVVAAAGLLPPWQAHPRIGIGFGYSPPALPSRSIAAQPQPSLGPAPPPIGHQAVTWIGRVLLGLLICLALVVIGGLLLRLRRIGRHADDPVTDLDDPLVTAATLRQAVQRARAYLTARRDTDDVPAAIIAAWAAVEQVAAEHGHHRRPHQTASEFTASLLGELSGAEREIDQLLRLYQHARFGSAEVIARLGADDVDRAEALLGVIADRLDHDQPSGQDRVADHDQPAGHDPAPGHDHASDHDHGRGEADHGIVESGR